MKCSICKKEIEVEASGWADGNNAEPINLGRCCTKCNIKEVIPARLKRLRNMGQ